MNLKPTPGWPLLALVTVLLIGLSSCAKENIELPKANQKTVDLELEALNRSDVIQASLEGLQMMPPVQTNASGDAFFVVGNGEEYLKYGVYVNDLESPTGLTLYLAPYGASGPMIASLNMLDVPEGAYNGELAQGQIREDNLMGPLAGDFPGLLQALKDQKVCIIVHTVQNPLGELRGQLKY